MTKSTNNRNSNSHEIRKMGIILVVIGIIIAFIAYQNGLLTNSGKVTRIAVPGVPQITPSTIPPIIVHTNSDGEFQHPPSIKDIDNDGSIDIVASSTKGVYAWKNTGSNLAGWPYLINPPYQYYFAPSLGDMDNDGKYEIFGGAESDHQLGLTYTGNPVTGWPQMAAGYFFNHSSTISDLDNDGDLEIIDGTRDSAQYYPAKVYAWNKDGSVVSGWPQTVGNPIARSQAVNDIDNDMDQEVIVADGLKVHVWSHDGSIYSPWPIEPQPTTQVFGGGQFPNYPELVASGDIDNDGTPNIVVVTYNYAYYEPYKRIWVHAYNANGTEVPNFPVEIGNLFLEEKPGIVLADLDNDQKLEIIVTTTKKFVIIKPTGAVSNIPSTNFPTNFPQLMGAVVANIDGDAEKEIIAPVWMDETPYSFYDAYGKIYAWNPDGTILNGFPIALPVIPKTGISIANIDGDTKIEVVGGWAKYDSSSGPTQDRVIDSGIYIQELPPQYVLGNVEWGTYANNIQHTNAHP